MAKDVLRTEYGLRREIRADFARAAEPDLLSELWQLLRRAANRTLRAVGLGGGEEATSPGGEPEPVYSGREQGPGQEREQGSVQEPGRGHVPSAEEGRQAWGPVPERRRAFMSEKTQSLHERMTGLEQGLRGLPPARRADVEDAILKELRGPGNKKLLAALIAAPDSMPVLARSFNNATARESRRMAPPGAGDVRPPEQRGSNTQVPRREVTAEEAMNAARDSIMAADAAQFAMLRSQWERPAQSRDPEAPRSFQDPSDDTLLDANSLDLLERQRLRDQESFTPEMHEVAHFDGGEFLPYRTEGLRQTRTPTPTPADSPSAEELRAVDAPLSPQGTADLAERTDWPLAPEPMPVSPLLKHPDLADVHESSLPPVSPLLDQIGLAVVNDPALVRGAPPGTGTTADPSPSRLASPARQHGTVNGSGQTRLRRG
ncbi:hypothetical protein [Streptomyces sp. NPDC090083]|uniref:hypothetical protein n=1 Tax=Streptomyces sp. NPDC090083 TaxID=3365941 RepID=UPI003824C190